MLKVCWLMQEWLSGLAATVNDVWRKKVKVKKERTQIINLEEEGILVDWFYELCN